MQKQVEGKASTTSKNNPKFIAKIKSYMKRELSNEAKPEVMDKISSVTILDKNSLSIFDRSIYVEPKGRSYYTSGEKLLSEHVRSFFERGQVCRQTGKELNKKICVILGDPGSGKTTFGRHFMRESFKRWENNPEQYSIPLWIPLSRLKLGCDRDRNQIYRDLLTYFFKDRIGLSPSAIRSLKTQPLHIFLDSYDEINYIGNLYDDNNWNQWPQTQFVIATRPEKFRSQPHSFDQCLKMYFSPNFNSLKALSVYTISRLDNELIQEFIEQWVKKQGNTEFSHWNKSQFWQVIETTPNIKLLAENPVMLTILLYALPALSKKYADKNSIERNRLEQLAIYDEFVSIWFAQQSKRIEIQLHDYPILATAFRKTICRVNNFSIKACLHAYTENLAYRCLLDSPDDKLGIEITSEQTLLPGLLNGVTGIKIFLATLSEDKTHDKNQQIILWLKLLRSGCLLRCDANYFAFFHKSLVEYFTQQHLFNNVCLNPTIVALEEIAYGVAKAQGNDTAKLAALNGKLLVKEHNLLAMLAKRTLSDKTFCNKLYDLVTYSCKDPRFSIAAANAITILKCAHQPLNHPKRDWRGLRVPGADLSYAILGHVQWQGGDLRNVNFYGAYLKDADFTYARLLGCQWPIPDKLQVANFLALPILATVVIYTWDGAFLIIGDQNGNIALYSTTTYQCEQILQQYPWYSLFPNYSVTALTVDGGVNNPKSSLLASASGPATLDKITRFILDQGTIYLWDLPSGNYRGKLDGHKHVIDDLQLTADGKQLVSHGIDGSIFIWDTQKLELIYQIKSKYDYFSKINVEFINESKFHSLIHTTFINEFEHNFFTAQTIYVSTTNKQDVYDCWYAGPYDDIVNVRIKLSHQEINELKVLPNRKNLKLVEKIIKLIGYREYVSPTVVLSPLGKYIFVLDSGDKQFKQQFFHKLNIVNDGFWFFQKEELLITDKIGWHLRKVNNMRFSPDERYLAACGSSGKIVLWSIGTNEIPVVLKTHSSEIKHFVFSANGEHIVAISDEIVERINLSNSISQIIYEGNTRHIGLSIDSSQIAICKSGKVILCAISSDPFTKEKTFECLNNPVLSRHGNYIVGMMDKKIALFSASTGKLEQVTYITGKFLGFSADESCFFYEKDSVFYAYRLKNNKEYLLGHRFDLGNLGRIKCDPSGKYIVQVTKSQIKLFALHPLLKDYVLDGHETDCDVDVFFSPNGACILPIY